MNYTNTRLVTKTGLKRLDEIKKEKVAKRSKVERVASTQAVNAITKQPELTHRVAYGQGVLVEGDNKPHESHDLRHFATVAAPVIFCNVCGKCSRHNARSQQVALCMGEAKWIQASNCSSMESCQAKAQSCHCRQRQSLDGAKRKVLSFITAPHTEKICLFISSANI